MTIRSYYISSGHTRLIRCLTLTGWVYLLQTRIDEHSSNRPWPRTSFLAGPTPASSLEGKLLEAEPFDPHLNPYPSHLAVCNSRALVQMPEVI